MRTPKGTCWERQAKNVIRGEMAMRGMTQHQLIEKLGTLGVDETIPNLRNKLSRGRFTAAFFLQIMTAIGVTTITLPQPTNGDADAAG